MKKISLLVFMIIFISFAFGFVSNAEDKNVPLCDSVWEIGDKAIFSATYYISGELKYYTCDWEYTIETEKGCRECVLYFKEFSNSLNGFILEDYDNWTPQKDLITHKEDGTTSITSNVSIARISPYPYTTREYTSTVLYTNIPIFENEEMARKYINGEIDINSALNYKKGYENGNFVRPFEDIEINDSNMSSPQLSNVSHNGFTVVNVPDDRYMVDVYMESGIQNPYPYENNSTSIGDAFYVNNFGLVSDVEGAYTGTIDILKCYGVDNVTALNQSTLNFYNEYSSLNEFNSKYMPNSMGEMGVNKKSWSIWGQPSGKSFVMFNKYTTTTISDASVCPLAFTNYKVRYFYYDDDTGFHYGPWTNFIYFSDGRVMSGEIFQGNDGEVIETPLNNGNQDSSGNVSINSSNLIDLDNPNELFGYIRSVINNVNATGNGFMALFANVFSFIPTDVQAIIWLGIGCMVLVGVVKALRG